MTEQMQEKLSLATLHAGEVLERIDEALEKAWVNILDGNTDPEQKREIGIKLIMKPNTTRTMVAVGFKIEPKLAAPAIDATTVFLGLKRNGEVVATEHDPKQGRLFDEPPAPPKIVKAEVG